MKRVIFILFAGIVGIVLFFILRPKQHDISERIVSPQAISTNTVTVVEPNSNLSTEMATQTTAPASQSIAAPLETKKTLDATKAKSIAEWTNAIPGLKVSFHSPYEDSWVIEQRDSTNYLSVLLIGEGGKSIQYDAEFIDIQVRADHIRRIEMHSPNLNIGEARLLGDTLLQVMDKDETSFNAWCDRVGNRWVDQPEYSSENSQLPNSNKVYGFEMRPTFNDEKPWYVLLIITDR